MADEYLYTKKPNIFKLVRKIVFFVLESALAVFLGWLVINYAVDKTVMIGDSMNTTFNDKDVLIVNKLQYRKDAPERFDIVVFNQGGPEHSFWTVRRIIGIPGDTLQIIDGYVYINGEMLTEKINVEKMRLSGVAEKQIELLENEYFVLGDNRNNAEDSRFSTVGLVSGNDIIGKVVIRLKPSIEIADKMNLAEDKKEDEEE